jgi:hypothetical protein
VNRRFICTRKRVSKPQHTSAYVSKEKSDSLTQRKTVGREDCRSRTKTVGRELDLRGTYTTCAQTRKIAYSIKIYFICTRQSIQSVHMNKYFHVTSRVREEKKTNAHGFENTERERERAREFSHLHREC